jgi:hypothetical protein
MKLIEAPPRESDVAPDTLVDTEVIDTLDVPVIEAELPAVTEKLVEAVTDAPFTVNEASPALAVTLKPPVDEVRLMSPLAEPVSLPLLDVTAMSLVMVAVS